MKTMKLLAAGFTLALVLFVSVAATIERDYLLRHLKVAPTTSQVSSNVAEFFDHTGTNSVLVTTQYVAGVVGARLGLRHGANTYLAVTNATFTVTNGGVVQTFTVRNGIVTVD